VPREVDLPGAKPDTVLNQTPAPDTLIYSGRSSPTKVKASGETPLPSNQARSTVRHVMPYDWYDKEVRVDQVDTDGTRKTVWKKDIEDTDDTRRTYVAGSALRITVTYIKEARVEIFVDGRMVEAYQGERRPGAAKRQCLTSR